jgi:hypothetical protein
MLRGLINPLLDAQVERDERFRETVLEGEQLGAAESAETADR